MRSTLIATVRTTVLGIASAEATFERRGFPPTAPDKRRRLEEAGTAFIRGYNAALGLGDAFAAADDCQRVPAELRGFAYEGAAMGLTLIDLVAGGVPRRFRAFVGGPAGGHIYMAHVGAGWALARCPWGWLTFAPRLDPLLRPLVIDGVGFHAAFFSPGACIDRCRTPVTRRPDPRAFDCGVGRAMWFACGAQPERIGSTLARFRADRHAALWSGVGLAATYAGGAARPDIEQLVREANDHVGDLAIGAAFAAKARIRAGNPTADTVLACEVICGVGPSSAAAVTDDCLARVLPAAAPDAYWRWRDLVKGELAREPAAGAFAFRNVRQ